MYEYPAEGAQRLLQEKIEKDRLAESKLKRIQVMANLQTADLKYEIIKRRVRWVFMFSWLFSTLIVLFCIDFMFIRWLIR